MHSLLLSKTSDLGSASKVPCPIGTHAPVVARCVGPLQDALLTGHPAVTLSLDYGNCWPINMCFVTLTFGEGEHRPV